MDREAAAVVAQVAPQFAMVCYLFLAVTDNRRFPRTFLSPDTYPLLPLRIPPARRRRLDSWHQLTIDGDSMLSRQTLSLHTGLSDKFRRGIDQKDQYCRRCEPRASARRCSVAELC